MLCTASRLSNWVYVTPTVRSPQLPEKLFAPSSRLGSTARFQEDILDPSSRVISFLCVPLWSWVFFIVTSDAVYNCLPFCLFRPNCELSWGKDLCCVLLGNLRSHNRCLLYVLGLKHTHTHTHTHTYTHNTLSLLAHPTSPKSKWTGFFKSKYRLMVRQVYMYLWDKRKDSEICLGKSRMWNQPSHPHDSITGEGRA